MYHQCQALSLYPGPKPVPMNKEDQVRMKVTKMSLGLKFSIKQSMPCKSTKSYLLTHVNLLPSTFLICPGRR